MAIKTNLTVPILSMRATTALARHVVCTDGCWIWTGGRDKEGYGCMTVGTPEGELRKVRAHRLYYYLWYGVWPGEHLVLHNCDNPSCVRAEHLYLGNQKQNMAEMVSKGRAARGDRSPRRLHPSKYPIGEKYWSARLTAQQVRDIYNLGHNGVPGIVLARQYGVSATNISRILQNRVWRHLNLSQRTVSPTQVL